MDLVQYSEARYQKVVAEYYAFLRSVGLEPRCFLPIAAKHGDNIAEPSAQMPWWQGPTVVRALDDFCVGRPAENQPLRFPVQDVYRFDDRRILAGRVESGVLKEGDRLVFAPGGQGEHGEVHRALAGAAPGRSGGGGSRWASP